MTRSNLTHDDVNQILRLVDELPEVELHLERDDLKLHIRKGLGGGAAVASSPLHGVEAPARVEAPRPASPATAAAVPEQHVVAELPVAGVLEEGLVGVRAPMLGRFYRSSSPSEPPFVTIGARVGEQDTVCLIEVMKLFNTVKAGVAGTVVAIHVENNSMVEFDQLLVAIRPD